MLIALYFLAAKLYDLPMAIMAWLQVITIVLMPLVIAVVGIMLICSAAGVRISEHLGATVLGGILNAVGYIGRTIISAIGWIVRQVFSMIPRIFHEIRRMLNQMGLSEISSTLLAVLITGLIII